MENISLVPSRNNLKAKRKAANRKARRDDPRAYVYYYLRPADFEVLVRKFVFPISCVYSHVNIDWSKSISEYKRNVRQHQSEFFEGGIHPRIRKMYSSYLDVFMSDQWASSRLYNDRTIWLPKVHKVWGEPESVKVIDYVDNSGCYFLYFKLFDPNFETDGLELE